MKKETMKRKNKDYQPPNMFKVIGSVILLMITFTFMFVVFDFSTAVFNQINREEIVYSDCIDTCQIKNSYTFKNMEVPRIVEFDRTDCVYACNEMYQRLRGIYLE